jgi:hypothetical protein
MRCGVWRLLKLASSWLLRADALAAVVFALAAVMAAVWRLMRCCESF